MGTSVNNSPMFPPDCARKLLSLLDPSSRQSTRLPDQSGCQVGLVSHPGFYPPETFVGAFMIEITVAPDSDAQ